VDAMKRRWLVGFGLEWSWIGDVSNLAYSKHKGISDFCEELGSFGFRGAYWFVLNVRGVPRVVGWPSMDTYAFLIARRDFKFRIGNKHIEGFVLPDKEPRVVDKLKG
jgi:hypothetical protein